MICNDIKTNPPENGKYLVKFYNKSMPEYECTETVWRDFEDGGWNYPFYNYPGDGYEMIGWYSNKKEQNVEANKQYGIAGVNSGKVLPKTFNTKREAKEYLEKSAYPDQWKIVWREVIYGKWQ